MVLATPTLSGLKKKKVKICRDQCTGSAHWNAECVNLNHVMGSKVHTQGPHTITHRLCTGSSALGGSGLST